jgi:hypothetical protein
LILSIYSAAIQDLIISTICSYFPNFNFCVNPPPYCFSLDGDTRNCYLLWALIMSPPLIFVVLAYSFPDLNFEILKIISIMFAVYFYGCNGLWPWA